MKFKSPTAATVAVHLTSGHCAQVTEAGVELDPIFHREAIARGCIPVGIEGKKVDAKTDPTRPEVIRAAIEKMLDSVEEGDFTADNKPDLKKLAQLAGFKVSREERDAAWELMQAELKSESPED